MPHRSSVPPADQRAPDESPLPRQALEALAAHVAVLDQDGIIIYVNQAWMRFALRYAGTLSGFGVGGNYLEICRRASNDEAHAALAGIESVLRGEKPGFSMEYPCHGDGEWRWFLMTAEPLVSEGRPGVVIAHQNITAQKISEHTARTSEQRFRAIFENAAVGVAEISVDGRWLRVNERLTRILGFSREEFAATTVQSLTHPDDRDADAAHREAVMTASMAAYSFERRFVRKDGSVVWLNSTLTAMRAEDHINYFVAVFEDVSEHRQAEQHLRTLLLETAHRGKNLLAVIQSIAARSLSGSGSVSEARAAFTGRLQALSSTYNALTDESAGGVLLDHLLKEELSPFGARATLAGPSILMTSKSAQTFALVIHELSTNAAKYGALSADGGSVTATWSVLEDEGPTRLMFEWREAGGPPAVAPTRRGFGSVLIGDVAGVEFECEPQLIYDQSGFRYRLEAPLARIGAPMSDSPVRRRLVHPLVCAFYDAWVRLRGPMGGLPPLAGFDWTHFAASGALTLAAAEGDASIRFIRVGRALLEQLGRPLHPDELVGEDWHSMSEAYQRCARKGEPCHELLRFDFGDANPVTFERLLLPFSAMANRTVTHLAGIAIYEGDTRPRASSDRA